jgi:A/G-specific adenine glycosylase
VLVSEIMLQQTQADRVVGYFERFVAKFPSFAALAAAPRAEVIQIWGGLGYNRRAVYLHQLAQEVEARYGGQLPRNTEQLRALPGIGPYTCGAILSIAFEQDEPALDTNVRRVVARYAFTELPDSRAIEAKARELLPRGRARDWNQAIMDLGATVCLARQPRCQDCPLRPGCRNRDRAFAIPHRSPPKYEGSTRYYRGHLLRTVRQFGAVGAIALTLAADDLQARGVAEPKAGWRVVSESLAQDGLLLIEEGANGAIVGLP